MAGVVGADDRTRFERQLFRTTRGNCYVRFAPIEQPIADPTTGEQVMKLVFIVFYKVGAQICPFYIFPSLSLWAESTAFSRSFVSFQFFLPLVTCLFLEFPSKFFCDCLFLLSLPQGRPCRVRVSPLSRTLFVLAFVIKQTMTTLAPSLVLLPEAPSASIG